MKISVILCSYGRPEQLRTAIDRLDQAGIREFDGELILVCSQEDIATKQVMTDFVKEASFPVSVFEMTQRGLSIARNFGIFKSRGQILIFADDDCYQEPGYIAAIYREMHTGEFQYGGGATIDMVESRNGQPHVRKRTVINPGTLTSAGTIAGNNMFFLRSVFDAIGGFRHDMGASSGTSFIGPEDWEMTTRCTLAGMKGILIPDAIVIHDHMREHGSETYAKTQVDYHLAAGAFYASMIARGITPIWQFWGSQFPKTPDGKFHRGHLQYLHNEFQGAADYVKYILDNNIEY